MKADWEERKLRELVALRPPKAEARERLQPTDIVSFVPMECLQVDSTSLLLEQTRTMESVSGSYTYFAEGDVLLAKITPCFENGKLGIARGLANGVGFGSSEFMVLRPSSRVSSEWIYYFLAQEQFRDAGASRMTGAVGHKRVPPEYVEECTIPVPPSSEQQRIVDILVAAFKKISTAKANAERNLESARAVFESAREDALAPRDGWRTGPLGDLCSIKHGFAFKGEFFTDAGEFVLLTPGSFFERGGYRERGEKTKYYIGEIPPEFLLNEGDMLSAMTEQAAGLLGSPLIVPESGKFLHNQRLGLFVPTPGKPWATKFFFHTMNLARVRKEIHDGGTGAKVRHTSPARIQAVQVSYPVTAKEQQVVADRLDEIAAESERLERIYEQKLVALNELKKSLLHHAFAGAL